MTNYTLTQALNVIKTHGLRDEFDPGLRRYHMRELSNSDVQKLADVWDARETLRPDLQQMDVTDRRVLERYASVAPGLLYSRNQQAEADKQKQAEQKLQEAQQEVAAQEAKARFYAELKMSYTGPAEDFDATANRLWREHLHATTQQALQRTKQLVRQSMIGIDF